MKNTNRFFIAAAAVALFASAGQIQAQYQAVGDDGIAASPKVRQVLNERKARASAPVGAPEVTINQAAPQDNIAASPKVQQLRKEQMARVATPGPAVEAAGYRATGADGITASPKVRAVLDERRQAVEIAPLK